MAGVRAKGLRVSELVAVRVTDIDGERSQLRIEQGKGHKDLHSTMRYLHWVPDVQRGRGHTDLVDLLGAGRYAVRSS
ncbi:hypothetical protein ACN2MM_09685 [Alkalilimnicola ehrlichii MLHE-1]|uniref:Tyr recombinase domain-containing protein n=1 Tax=Alkalilimnicola ehrlichii (strain ATCC BAA-1101 / DSM 17681 / MLHE-1) TaxID=187272 RepID=Q0A7Q5_ALKEH|nr:hypothetical protein [Alkalilimnicola ehrlichii]ABI57132.1 hypothetical protein Mlg_1788 [Alkalilimnicola ehrlichii MLHE-1]